MRWVKKAGWMTMLWLCAAVLLAVPCSGAASWASGEGGAPENHFVIMYDMSGSMQNADRRLKGMVADFLLQVPSRLMPYKIAVIPFADRCPQTDVLENTENVWWEIQTENGEPREKIRDALSKLAYTGSYTDIEEALRICARTLAAMREDGRACDQTVLFITDGLIDLRASRDGDTRSRIDNIIASGRKVPDIAEDFPNDCKFWAIMPDEETKNSFVTLDADGNILTYTQDKLKVEEYQQAGIRAVLTCLEDFCSRLNALGQAGMGTRAGTIPMNWTKDTLQHFKTAYTKFFESLWDTTAVTRERVDLNEGIEFWVPEGTAEVNVTVMPEIEDPDECQQVAERLAGDGGLLVTRDEAPYPAECSGSIYTANVKLIAPPAGVYSLRTDIDQKCSFTLDFLTYSDLKIVTSEQDIVRALGSTVELEGSITDPTGKQVTEDTARGFTLEAWVSSEPGGDGDHVPIGLNGGSFQYSFTADRVGESFLTLYASYDDTGDPASSNGVSKFGCRETIRITVPRVSYRIKATGCFYTGVDLELWPYSELPEGLVNVSAEAAKKYLNDDWVVLLLDGQRDQIGPDIPIEISEDGTHFMLKCVGKGAKVVVVMNHATGETIEVPIADSWLPVIILVIAIAVLVIVVAVVVFVLAQRKVTVTIRWNGETIVRYLNWDGSPESGVLGGESVTARVEKKSRKVVAQLGGRTRREDIVGHSCDIDF